MVHADMCMSWPADVDEQSKLEIKAALLSYDRTLLVADPRRMEPKKCVSLMLLECPCACPACCAVHWAICMPGSPNAVLCASLQCTRGAGSTLQCGASSKCIEKVT